MGLLDAYDPADAQELRQRSENIALGRRPLCGCCRRRIQTDSYLVLKGAYYCQGCVDAGTRDTAGDFDWE